MKKTNSLLVLFIVLALGFTASAQVNFGIKAGANLSNISQDFKNSDYEFNTKFKPGFHLGVIADVPFSDNFSLQPGLLFTSKGYNYDMEALVDDLSGGLDGVEVDGYYRSTLNYLEVPINFAFKTNNFQIFAGPYVAMGINGSDKWDYTISYMGIDETEKDELKLKPFMGKVKEDDLADDEDAFSALDYGINAGIGYQIGQILVQGGYSMGLGNIYPAYEGESDADRDDFKMSNRVITLSVSYFFGE